MPLTISLRPNPTPTDGKKSLNAFPYDSNPSWHTIRDYVTIGYSTITTPFTFNLLLLSSFSNWNSTFASSIFSTTLPSSYFYLFDGNSNSISDGGNDMWDTGNQISLTFGNLRAGLSTLNYGAMSTFSNSATGLQGGFYLSPSNQWPQTGIGYIKNGTIGWTNAGNVGTDGQVGSASVNTSGTYTCKSGRYGSYWVNQNYGANDPSIIYTWYTIQQDDYGTVISSCNDNRKTVQPPANAYVQHFNLTGCNIIFAQTLLSVRRLVPAGGYQVDDRFIQGFLSTFVEAAVLNFS
jgi:hypothetical protein